MPNESWIDILLGSFQFFGIRWNWIIISQRIVMGYYYNIPNIITIWLFNIAMENHNF